MMDGNLCRHLFTRLFQSVSSTAARLQLVKGCFLQRNLLLCRRTLCFFRVSFFVGFVSRCCPLDVEFRNCFCSTKWPICQRTLEPSPLFSPINRVQLSECRKHSLLNRDFEVLPLKVKLHSRLLVFFVRLNSFFPNLRPELVYKVIELLHAFRTFVEERNHVQPRLAEQLHSKCSLLRAIFHQLECVCRLKQSFLVGLGINTKFSKD